jgi:hypothetical protein
MPSMTCRTVENSQEADMTGNKTGSVSKVVYMGRQLVAHCLMMKIFGKDRSAADFIVRPLSNTLEYTRQIHRHLAYIFVGSANHVADSLANIGAVPSYALTKSKVINEAM